MFFSVSIFLNLAIFVGKKQETWCKFKQKCKQQKKLPNNWDQNFEKNVIPNE
jgi:hypothetical protein